jgi:hypothetical protein
VIATYVDMEGSDLLYLHVRNSDGDIVGLMRGPFRVNQIRRVGYVSFVLPQEWSSGADEWPLYQRVDMRVDEWCFPRRDGTYAFEVVPVLTTSLPLDELRRIRFFR